MQTKKNVTGIHRDRHSLKNPDFSHVKDKIKTKTNKTKSKHKNKNQSYLELLKSSLMSTSKKTTRIHWKKTKQNKTKSKTKPKAKPLTNIFFSKHESNT